MSDRVADYRPDFVENLRNWSEGEGQRLPYINIIPSNLVASSVSAVHTRSVRCSRWTALDMAASPWATLMSSPQSSNSAWDLLLSEGSVASSSASSSAASDEVEPTLSDYDRFAGAELISSPSLSRKTSKEQCDARKPGDGSNSASPTRLPQPAARR